MPADLVMVFGIGKIIHFSYVLLFLLRIKYEKNFNNFRVKAQGFLSNDMVAVEKWDIGDVDHLPVNALRPLGPSYRKTPRAVFCAQLHGN